MGTVAVLAHSGKSFGGGLEELRAVLAAEGVTDPLWFEVPKSKKAPAKARKALKAGADLVFVWGGDGMVQRCIDALAGTGVAIAIVPAGTGNLLAGNLGIPKVIEQAVQIGLHGERRPLDVGVMNGERFAVMAGTGFDALTMRDADGPMKDRLGRIAYVLTGAKHLNEPRVKARIKVDGEKWFKGKMGCVLLGNVGTLIAGIEAFDDARPDDGVLELGVVTAEGAVQWARALGRTALGHAQDSKFVRTAHARAVDVRLDHPLPYQLDGGDRPPTKRLRISVEPGAVNICVLTSQSGDST
jgi:diacylglycerol kinase family enzyme